VRIFCLPKRLTTLHIAAGVLLSAIAAVAQSEVPVGQPPQAPGQVAVTTSQTQDATSYFTAVTPQYNFSYAPDPRQPKLPTSNVWISICRSRSQVRRPMDKWCEYNIGGLYDTFYYEPTYTTGGSVAAM